MIENKRQSLLQYSNGQAKVMQRKIKSSKLIFENQKQNTSGSDLESLLVSSIRCDFQAPLQNIIESQGHDFKSRPSQIQQSLIKKQYVSNVYIEESGENSCHLCQKKIDAVEENLTIINLKLQELESRLNICFGKYGKTQTKLGQVQILMEQFKHCEKETSQRMKEMSSNSIKYEQQVTFKLREFSQQLNKIKKISFRMESKQSEKVCMQSKLIEHKLQKFKDEQQFKLKEIVETIEKMGKLQRKMIEQEGQKSDESTIFLYDGPTKKKYFRASSICSKNRTNQSTNISYSRNYQCLK